MSETLQSVLTLKARQVCNKCSAGSGPASHRRDLRGLESPPDPGVRMSLLPTQSHKQHFPSKAQPSGNMASLEYFSFFPHVFLEEKVECLSLEKKVCCIQRIVQHLASEFRFPCFPLFWSFSGLFRLGEMKKKIYGH